MERERSPINCARREAHNSTLLINPWPPKKVSLYRGAISSLMVVFVVYDERRRANSRDAVPPDQVFAEPAESAASVERRQTSFDLARASLLRSLVSVTMPAIVGKITVIKPEKYGV
jgi:hypothetical protein